MARRPPPGSLETSRRLAKQKQSDTRPELIVRRVVHSLGHRFRIHNRDLPGSPDLANRRRGWAIFVHGCYWHGHEGCPRATVPKTNSDWWIEKFADNRRRDIRKEALLREMGVRVIVVWECELADLDALRARVAQALDQSWGKRDE
jgi:DNA mismatch endonuclease (patch repair protein)